MDYIQILAWLAGIGSFVFAIYRYVKDRENKLAETAKLSILKERMRNVHSNIIVALNDADHMVQHAKTDNASIESLQEMARMVRALLFVVETQVRSETVRLSQWRYGELVSSTGFTGVDEHAPEDKGPDFKLQNPPEKDL